MKILTTTDSWIYIIKFEHILFFWKQNLKINNVKYQFKYECRIFILKFMFKRV